ncbi:hypothetical protein ABS71_02825 [bacterium SCN 62-11]|nr:MAG: hypothetical protein ABS71_02825 [bacterium SCN 62-11]
MIISSGFLGSDQQFEQTISQASQHQLGDLPNRAEAASGTGKPQGGQNPQPDVGRGARNSSDAGLSDSAQDNNASSTPTPISGVSKQSGCPPCDCQCPKRYPPSVLYGAWNQSNRESYQNAAGSFVPSEQFNFFEELDLDFNYQFSLPFFALNGWGLARAVHPPGEPGNVYRQAPSQEWVVAWTPAAPDGKYNFAIAGYPYDAADADPGVNWRCDFEVNLSQPVLSTQMLRVAKFFYGQLGRWCNLIPNPEASTPTCYSARRRNDGESATSSLNKPAYGASYGSYSRYDLSRRIRVGDLRLFLALPYVDASSFFAIDFFQQDVETGSLTLHSSLDLASLAGGLDLTPVAHPRSQPICWHQNGVTVFSSLREADLRILYQALQYKPETGEIAGLHQEVYEITDSPTVYEAISFKTEAEATSYNGLYGDVFEPFYTGGSPTGGGVFSHGLWWMGDVAIAPDSSEDFQTLQDLTFVQLPAEEPNLQRFGTLAGQSAVHWPPLKNSGNSAIDSDNREWRVILKPIQRLYGGQYSIETTVGLIPTWERYHQLWSETCGNIGSYESTGIFVKEDPSPYFVDNPLQVPAGSSEDCGDIFDLIWYTYRGLQDRKVATWKQKQTILWETWLQCTDLVSGRIEETNISQHFTVEQGASLTRSGSTSVSAEQEGVPAADNVHQVISLPEIGRVLVLRDLHADDPDGTASPHLQIYDSSAGTTDMPLESTIPLGTQDLLSTPKDGWNAGDREWDAYWKGPPRMKACLRAEPNGPLAPRVIVAVWGVIVKFGV